MKLIQMTFLNAGQCNDCFLPSFNYRPLGSAQYVLALSDFTRSGNPKRFKFGFIGSSDNHGLDLVQGTKKLIDFITPKQMVSMIHCLKS